MKQFGDITGLNGAKLEQVDLIVGGSPCQNLSLAGNRKGLEGEQSWLFMEMIRIIKEMRNATNFIRPRFALWENVAGAYSSRGGEDFSVVLGEFSRVIEQKAPNVPIPEKGWSESGVLLGSDWSIAWRTHNAQYWGTPQRRKRIALVADFRGRTAPEILFEPKGLSWNTEQSAEKGDDITAKTKGNIDTTIYDVRITSNGTKNWRAHAYETDISRNLDCDGGDPNSNHGGCVIIQKLNSSTRSIARRLTPVECERLQGFPDYWTDVPEVTDAKRFKVLGNSIALPFWAHLAKRLVDIGEVKTIGSLFDGIGGFPLVFGRAGAETLWTSEIDPLCQQITKIHFL